MRSIVNKTPKALRVPLPGGRSLFLGPGARGQVPAGALERPAFRKLLDAGDIELLADDQRAFGEAEQPARPHRGSRGHPADRSHGHKGDR
jgi:hypothetical protein